MDEPFDEVVMGQSVDMAGFTGRRGLTFPLCYCWWLEIADNRHLATPPEHPSNIALSGLNGK